MRLGRAGQAKPLRAIACPQLLERRRPLAADGSRGEGVESDPPVVDPLLPRDARLPAVDAATIGDGHRRPGAEHEDDDQRRRRPAGTAPRKRGPQQAALELDQEGEAGERGEGQHPDGARQPVALVELGRRGRIAAAEGRIGRGDGRQGGDRNRHEQGGGQSARTARARRRRQRRGTPRPPRPRSG